MAWDDLAAQLKQRQTQPPDQAQPAPTPAAAPAAEPVDWDQAAGAVKARGEAQRAADIDLVRFRDQHFAAEPARAAKVLRMAAATGLDPDYLWKNQDELEPRLAPYLEKQVDWDRVAKDHPTVFGAVLDPLRGPVIRQAVADLRGLDWALTGRWEVSDRQATPEDAARWNADRRQVAMGAPQVSVVEAGVEDLQPMAAGDRLRTLEQAVPSGPQAALRRGMTQQEAIHLGFQAYKGQAPADYEQRREDLRELQDSDLGAKGWLQRGALAPIEMAPYLAGRVGASAAGRAAVGAGGALLGGIGGALTTRGPGVIPGAVTGFTAAEAAVGWAGDYAAGVGWDTYQQVGPLFEQLRDLKDPTGNRILSDEEARSYALTGATIAAGITSGLGGKFAQSIPGVKQAIARASGGAVEKALVQATVGRAVRDLVRTGATHLAEGALMMAAQQGAAAATLEAAQANHSEHNFDWRRVGDAAAEGFSSGVRDLWLLSFWAPGRQFLRDTGLALESRRSALRIERGVDAEAAAREKLPPGGEPVLDDLVSSLAQQKGTRDLFFRKETWDGYWQKLGVDPAAMAADVLGDGGKAYGEAQLTGGDLVVPFARASKVLLRAKGAQELVKLDARLSPEARSERERAIWSQGELARMRKLAASPDHVAAKARVAELVRQQALAAGESAGSAAANARIVSEFVGNMAARLNVPVAEAAVMTGAAKLRILGEKGIALDRLKQEKVLGGALPEFFKMLAPESAERVRKALGGIDAAGEQGRAVLELGSSAYRDEGTGLPNRLAWQDMLHATAIKNGAHLAADLQDLKVANDIFGHDTGNEAIGTFGQVFRTAVEKHGGKLARTGGDELQGWLPSTEAARAAAADVTRALQELPALRTREHVEQLSPDARARALATLPDTGEFRLSARIGIGPTPKGADLAEGQARAARAAKYGDIREAGKVTAGHGETFVHDAYDPSSPVHEQAMATVEDHLRKYAADHPGQQPVAEIEPGVVVATTELEQAGASGEHGSLHYVVDDGTGKPLEATIHLQDPNALTLAHETAHWMLEALSRMASRGELTDPAVRADYDGLVKWMGYGSHEERTAQARERAGLALEQNRPAERERRLRELQGKEERFAYAWEQFLGEGRPPAKDLATAFRRFSGWLARIYQGLQGVEQRYRELHGRELGLNDQVRDIFRRLVASEEEIGQAKRAEELLPSPVALERMTPAERARWEDLDRRDRALAEAEVVRALVVDDRRQQREAVNRIRDEIANDVADELDRNPVYRAISYLTTGRAAANEEPTPELVDPHGQPWKLSRAELLKQHGAELVRTLPQEGLAEKGGVSADDLAAALGGFPNGDALVRAMAAAEPRARLVKREMARRVLDRLGPLLIDDPLKLQEVALDASWNEAAAAKFNLESRALARELDPEQSPATPPPDHEFLSAQARRILGEKPIGEISPEYFRRAAQASARRAFEIAAKAAAAEGENRRRLVAQAYDERNAVWPLNLALAKEAAILRDRLDSAHERLAKTNGDAWRSALGKASPTYRDAHDQILEAAGLRSRPTEYSPRASLDQMLAQAQADAAVVGFDVAGVRELLASPRSWTDLTPDQASLVSDAVTNIRRAANLRNEFVLADKRLSKDDLLAEMASTAAEALPLLSKAERDPAAEGVGAALRRGFQGLRASLLGTETMVQMLAGAKKDGVFHRVFVDSFLACRNKEEELARTYGKALLEAWQKLPAELARLRFERIDLSRDLPLTAELRERANLGDQPVTRTYLWMLFLNRGNRQNLQRLVDGYGWTVDQVDAVLEQHLTPAEGRFLQSLWNSLEGLYPEIEALHERDTGLKPGKVRPAPFTLRLAGEEITFPGGYFPAKYDPRPGMSQRGFVAQERDIAGILDPQSLYPGTPKSHTKARVERVEDVINLDWTVVPGHVSQVLHDLAWREYVRQTAAIVVDPRFETIVSSRLGPEFTKQFRPWLQSVASDKADAVSAEVRSVFGLMGFGRNRAMIAAVGHSLATALGDMTNPILAVMGGYVRPDYLARATARLTPGAPGWREAWTFVLENSSEIRHRRARAIQHLRDQLDDVGQRHQNMLQRNPVTAPIGDLVAGAQRTAFITLETTDKLTSTQLWLSSYLQERAAAEKSGRPDPHSYAVREANGMIRKLFPAESVGERPAILRKKWLAPLLMFYGFFSKVHQARELTVATAARELRAPGATAGDKTIAISKAAGRILGISAALAISDLASGRGREQDEDWAAWWRRKMAAAQVIDLPLVGPWLEPMWQKLVDGRATQVSVRAAPGLALGQAVMDKVSRIANEGREWDAKAWDAVDLAGLGLGVPTRQLRSTGEYLTSGRAGEDLRNRRPAEVASGLVYGERERQPRTPPTALEEFVDWLEGH